MSINNNQILEAKPSGGSKALAKAEFIKSFGAFIVLIALVIVNIIATNNFLSVDTFWNLITQSAPTVFIGMGLTFVIATGGIDISVGSVMAFSGIITLLLFPVVGIFLAVIIGLAFGMLTGAFTGLMVVKFDIQPIVITLAMMIMLRAIARILSDAKNFMVTDDSFTTIGLQKIGGEIPVQLVYIVLLTIAFTIIAKYTVFGKSVEAIGNNRKAATLSGINVSAMVLLVYAILGAMAGMAGVLTIARSGSCNTATLGDLIELDAIAAVVIGGTKMEGGKARIIGTTVGCLIITLITMTVNMNNIPYEYSQVMKAAIIIFAVYLQIDKKYMAKKKKESAGKTLIHSKN